MNIENYKNQIEEIYSDLIEFRRQIHKNPEIGMKEFETTDLIVKKLKEYGIEDVKKIGETGVVAHIYGAGKNCIAIRTDIDALTIVEETDLEFKSQNGFMHGCGHDIHTTCLLGTAYLLNKNKKDINGVVKLIFQPAEETGKGALYMIEHNALENPKPSAIFGLHTWPNIEAGKILHKHGIMSASSDIFYVTIKGKQGHAAHPENTVDPVYIAGNIIVSAQSIISREISPLKSAVITFANVESGGVSNVIPSEAKLKGSIRTFDEESREFIHKRFEEVCKNIAKTFRGEAEVLIKKGAPSMENDIEISKVIEDSAKLALGEENYIENKEPSTGSEDFSYYRNYTKGAMYRLGTGFKNTENPPLHSNKFNPNEESIKTGVLVNTITAIRFLKNNK